MVCTWGWWVLANTKLSYLSKNLGWLDCCWKLNYINWSCKLKLTKGLTYDATSSCCQFLRCWCSIWNYLIDTCRTTKCSTVDLSFTLQCQLSCALMVNALRYRNRWLNSSNLFVWLIGWWRFWIRFHNSFKWLFKSLIQSYLTSIRT